MEPSPKAFLQNTEPVSCINVQTCLSHKQVYSFCWKNNVFFPTVQPCFMVHSLLCMFAKEQLEWKCEFTRDENTVLESVDLSNPTCFYIKWHVHMTPTFQLRQSQTHTGPWPETALTCITSLSPALNSAFRRDVWLKEGAEIRRA